ncbi:MAG: hypothetical protein ACTSWQ_10100 [Candidatus Thorarchaeota archaeon]
MIFIQLISDKYTYYSSFGIFVVMLVLVVSAYAGDMTDPFEDDRELIEDTFKSFREALSDSSLSELDESITSESRGIISGDTYTYFSTLFSKYVDDGRVELPDEDFRHMVIFDRELAIVRIFIDVNDSFYLCLRRVGGENQYEWYVDLVAYLWFKNEGAFE